MSTPGSSTATPSPAVNGRVVSAGHRGSGPSWLAPSAGVGGATLLATWALLEGRRRRARRLRRSRPGEVMPPGDPTIAPVSAAVHTAADVAGVERIAAALSHLAKLGKGSLRPQLLLRHPDGRIDVFLATVVASCPPWTAGNKRCWTLAPDAELPPADPDVTPCPALVQLGVCDDGAELYADLEGIGMLGLSGPPETVRQIARALTATLVVSPAARLCRVLTVGFDPYGLDEQVERRFVAAKSVDALMREAEATASEIVAGVAAHNAGSSFRLRSLAPESGWEPTMVVVAGTALASDETARLAELAGDGGQGAAVICSGVESFWSLDVDDLAAGWWHLSPIDIRMRPVQMAADELAELAAFLADADAEPVRVDVEIPPVPVVPPRPTVPAAVRQVAPVEAARLVTGGRGYVERPWRVLIRLYGPPDVTNRDGAVVGGEGRDAPLQVLVWLATNRDTATRQGTATAVWCGRAVTPKTVSNALHGARALLRGLAGEPTDGSQWIPTMSERLLLHREAVSDFELLADRATYARRLADPAEAAEILAGGLALIRGVPLAGVEWQWPDQHHLTSGLAMAASGLATDLAALYFKVGDVGGALEATEVGLRVIPGHEELTRLKIQACMEAGDRAGALAVYEEYERTVMANDEMVHPAIAKLRDALLKPSRT